MRLVASFLAFVLSVSAALGQGYLQPRPMFPSDMQTAWGAQYPGYFLAAPSDRSGLMGFRAIVGADVPAVNLAASGNGGVTGNLPVGNLNGAWAFGGRLTLESGNPVPTGSDVAVTTLYYAPYYRSNTPGRIAIYNGTTAANYSFLSGSTDIVGLSITGFGTAPYTDSHIYDVFVTLNSGTPTLCTGPAWSSDGAPANPSGSTPGSRAASGGLASYNGVMTNASSMSCNASGATTLTVPQYQGTWVGTVETGGGAGKLYWQPGTYASGGGISYLFVWNAYNQVLVTSSPRDSNAAYDYSSATCRAADGSASNAVLFVTGDPLAGSAYVMFNADGTAATVAYAYGYAGAALNSSATDSTCMNVVDIGIVAPGTVITAYRLNVVVGAYSTAGAQLGLNTLTRVEFGDGTNNTHWAAGGYLSFTYPM